MQPEYSMGTKGDKRHTGDSTGGALYYTARTVVFADVVESVRLMQRDELTAAHRMRALLLEAVEEIVPANHGHLLQRLGDGLMLDFSHPRDAAACARALHRRCAELSANLAADDRVLLRIGIHAADILTDDVAFYGHGVNVAARLAALAGPGETVISAAARDALTAGLDGEIEDLGSCHLKNVATPLRAYRLGPRNALALPPDDQVRLRPTLAVIPFALRSGGREFLAVGEIIADEVITALSQAPELRVVSRLSTTAFRGRKLQLDDVRAYLGATYVLSGGYRAVGDVLIVNVELADARNNEVMWAKGFRGRVSGLLAQDDELVRSLVEGVSHAIMSTEIAQTATRALPTLDAGTLLLGGIGLMHRSDRRDFDKSRRAFEHLIERYPRYSAPYAYLAEWHVFRVAQGWFENLEQEAASALDRINRALDIDAEDSLALTVNGMVHTNLLRKHDVAKRSYDLALQRNPNAGLAWLHRGTLWAFQGRGREAMDETGRAVALSPLDPWRYYYDSLCATAALSARDYERAISLARRSLRANRTHASTLRVIAIAASELGRMDEARDIVAELRELDPSLTVSGYLARSPARNFETSRIWAEALRRAELPA
jgi:class 3 adenylate cyclase/TolB-like protein/tetratricopeptide (TPR) repeat protein